MALTLSTTDLVDYVDANGYSHFVTRLATINADDSVTDTRARRTITLTGDVSGEASFNGPDSIELEVHVEDNSHGHTEGLQEALAGKAEQEHTHSPAEIGALPSDKYIPLRDALAATNLNMTAADIVDFDTLGPGYCHLVDVTASTGTKPAGFGNQFGFLTVQYIYGGNADGERALLMKLEPYDGNGRACWRNYSVNSDTWKVWEYAYTDHYKPTAAEVGAVPTSEGTAEYARQLIPKNASWGDQTDRFRTGSAQAPAGSGRTEYVDWIQWGHNGGQKIRHTLWCPADSSKSTELWFAYLNNTTDTDGPATHWRIYHQGFKPTAADVGLKTFWGQAGHGVTLPIPAGYSAANSGFIASGFYLAQDGDDWHGADIRIDPSTRVTTCRGDGNYTDPWMYYHVIAGPAIAGVTTRDSIPDETEFAPDGQQFYICSQDGTCLVTTNYLPDAADLQSRAEVAVLGLAGITVADARLVDGQIAAITPDEATLRDAPRRRIKALSHATTQASHWDMMGDTEQATAWRGYYRELHALEASPEWPLVEQWPVAPELAA